MKHILCTFPGRHGDLLWALPTVRAIAETVGHPVDFATTGKYGRIASLVKAQDYIGGVHVLKEWEVEEGAPMRPTVPPHIPDDYDRAVHLGYPGWPELPLPFYIEKIGKLQFPQMFPIDLNRPWIKAEKPAKSLSTQVAVGFSDEHFELKYGLWSLLTLEKLSPSLGGSWISLMGAPGSRWVKEGGHGEATWELTAHTLTNCSIFLGCCSSLHVLACAMGKRVLIMEPNEQRWNPVFYPYGMDGPQVLVIRGGDGRPTFDARHVRDQIHALLS
jgi:hypothetical protein